MCGIFGAIFDDQPVDAAAALASIAHRGPDGSNIVRLPGATLGHVRLAVIDLSSAANQPMGSTDGDVVLVFNGEIYNYRTLRQELIECGHAFRTRSDTEVILEGYRAWGDDVIERIDGMFAVALFDRVRRRVLLARDRVGKKPLFFTRSGGGLRFASEIKALLASGTPFEMDIASLATLLSVGYCLPPRTMVRGVEQLPPASTLTLEEGGTPKIRRYWRAPFDSPRTEIPYREAVHAVRRTLDAAVSRRLEADVPLGAFLSGGIDSTIIVGSVARQIGRRLKTFSLGFAHDARYDETHHARVVARAFDTDHTEFVVQPSSFELVERLVELHDGPFGDSSAIPTSIVSMLARREVTVALTGDGGDELFCGYPRFLAVELSELIPPAVRSLGTGIARRWPPGPSGAPPLIRAARAIGRATLPLPERLLGYVSYFTFDLDRLLRRDSPARSNLGEAAIYHREAGAGRGEGTTMSRILEMNFETYLPFDLLVKADRASMLHSLELRSPFLDTEVIELAARFPAHWLRRGRGMKRILREAYRDLIPPRHSRPARQDGVRHATGHLASQRAQAVPGRDPGRARASVGAPRATFRAGADRRSSRRATRRGDAAVAAADARGVAALGGEDGPDRRPPRGRPRQRFSRDEPLVEASELGEAERRGLPTPGRQRGRGTHACSRPARMNGCVPVRIPRGPGLLPRLGWDTRRAHACRPQ